ncbi:RING finger protein 121/175 [Nematocida sp. LUAm3]|nr:RING finger protein 121/175 [Nematocida sp. LUAm3]KAI5175323.1 RING finger protein 121/175 [Nematocida sp. LUAm2]KAI5177720.1 RING finger protein 121/175 [Nematocida sp. LUAm1]
MSKQEELPGKAHPEQKAVVIDNVIGMHSETTVHSLGDKGIIVQKLVVVEVDRGERALLSGIFALCIIFVAIHIVSFLWKKYNKKSFYVASTLVLLFFPLLMGIIARANGFILVWILVIFAHLIIYRDILLGRRPRSLHTNVYRVYRHIFRGSLLLSGLGYLMVVYGFFFSKVYFTFRGILLLMYVLYFTLIVRAGLEYISYKASGTILPSKMLKKESGICPLCQTSVDIRNTQTDKAIVLDCKEAFHEDCLKNWKILANKKDTCPSCRERVDLSGVIMNPWQKNEYFFTQFLDFTNNLILAYAVTQGLVLLFKL